MPGRRVANPGDKSREPQTQLMTFEQVESLISTDRSSFTNFANELHDASMKMFAAVDAKDSPAAVQAGAAIQKACENYHVRFWYSISAPRLLRP